MRHELAIARSGLKPALAITAAVALVGFLFGGPVASVSAILGASLVVVNHLIATALSGTLTSFGLGEAMLVWVSWAARMLGVAIAFAFLATFVDKPWTAAGFIAALVVSLAAECISFARGSYVPAWRTIR